MTSQLASMNAGHDNYCSENQLITDQEAPECARGLQSRDSAAPAGRRAGTHLKVAVDHPVDLEVVVVVAERVEERLGDSQPAHVEKELQPEPAFDEAVRRRRTPLPLRPGLARSRQTAVLWSCGM